MPHPSTQFHSYITPAELRSFIDVAADSDFPIQNLPYGAFAPATASTTRIGVAIGDFALDLSVLADAGLLGDEARAQGYFSDPVLNRFMEQGRSVWRSTRQRITELLRDDCPTLRDNAELRARALHRRDSVTLSMPIRVGGYTDFYSSIDHARNVGALFRGVENALNPNWRHLPIAYDGRAGSIVVSGTDLHRPLGQTRPSEEAPPVFGPSKALDFELEVAFVVGTSTKLGESIPCSRVDDHVFGVVLLNDWSARDIQKWEYQPLGPFLGKNFGTSISPWIVSLDALAPFSVEAQPQDPEPLEYLRSNRRVFDLQLEVAIRSAKMPQHEAFVTTRSNAKFLYWDHHQQLAHHTVNGCSVAAGDLFATGTISGPTPDSLGCLLEITKGGKEVVVLPTGEERRFLADGDTVRMRGWCQGTGFRVGFGEVTGAILPAKVA
jgi:fumarylacetoacetase